MSQIINSHTHLGGSWVTDNIYTEKQLLQNMEENHIDGMIVLPIPEPTPDSFEAHNRIHDFIQSVPVGKRIWGVCDMHPRHPEDIYVDEVRRCVEDLGFVALKLHPLLHGVDPLSRVADKAFRVADELHIPLMVQTGIGPFLSPLLYVKRAQQYPNVKIVLCICEPGMAAEEALEAAVLCPNIYIEPSWCSVQHIEKMIHAIGAERVIMGSENIVNTAMELAKVSSMKTITEQERQLFLGEAAVRLFNLQ